MLTPLRSPTTLPYNIEMVEHFLAHMVYRVVSGSIVKSDYKIFMDFIVGILLNLESI